MPGRDYIGPLIGAIGGVGSTMIDAASARRANAANAEMARRRMEFEKQQSETQYQRGVEDMRRAGLNPALAYQQGGNAAGGGAQATIEPETQNTVSKFATALDTYNAVATGVAQRDLIREQTNATQADAKLKLAQANIAGPEAILSQEPGFINQFWQTRRDEMTKRQQEARNYPEQFRTGIVNLNAQTANANAVAANARSQTILNEQEMTNEWFRRNVQPYLNSTAATVKPISDLFKIQPQRFRR